nr:MAG TPA: hypothetical protein [Caudoviricetes sp.]
MWVIPTLFLHYSYTLIPTLVGARCNSYTSTPTPN